MYVCVCCTSVLSVHLSLCLILSVRFVLHELELGEIMTALFSGIDVCVYVCVSIRLFFLSVCVCV